jgi:hypothetical protein
MMMIIDMTDQLAPILWAMVGLLLFLGGAIVANFEAEAAEVYFGNRGLLVVTAAVVVVTIVGLVVVRPDLAVQIGIPSR